MSCVCLGYLLGEAKITNLSIHLHIQKDVTALYISMYNSWFAPIMQVVQSFKRNEILRLSLNLMDSIHQKIRLYHFLFFLYEMFRHWRKEKKPFAASTAIFNLRTQLRETFLLFGPDQKQLQYCQRKHGKFYK